MQRHLVGGLQVDAFDNVDFASRGPVGSHEPEGRPGAAADGHVGDISDEETFVVGFGGADAHAGTTGVGDAGVVYAHVVGCVVVGDAGHEALLCCVLIVHIYDEAVRWVGVCEGGEVAEEGVFAIVIFEYIACYAVLDEDHKEEEEEHHDVLEELW